MDLKNRIKNLADTTTSKEVKDLCQTYLNESEGSGIDKDASLTESLFNDLKKAAESDDLVAELLNENEGYAVNKRKIEAKISGRAAAKLMENWGGTKNASPVGNLKNNTLEAENKKKAKAAKALNESLTEAAKTDPSAGKVLKDLRVESYGIAEAIETIKKSKVMSGTPQLKYAIARYEGHIENNVSESRFVKDFLSNMAGYAWDPTVNEAYSAVKTLADAKAVEIEVQNAIQIIAEQDKKNFFGTTIEQLNKWLMNEDRSIPGLVKEMKQWMFNPVVSDLVKHVQILENSYGNKFNVPVSASNCSINNIYSPINMVAEGMVFRAGDNYFLSEKEGGIIKLSEEQVNGLPIEYTDLCESFFNDAVRVSDEGVHVNIGRTKVTINEDGTFIGESAVEASELGHKLLMHTQKTMFKGGNELIGIAVKLQENQNKIAEIDYGKSVFSNLYENVGVYLFRKGEKLYINKVNPSMNENTFNEANAVQTVTMVKEFLNYDLSESLVDMLDGDLKKKALMESEMTEVLDNINLVEAEINKIEDAIAENAELADVEEIAKAKEMLESELNKLKSIWHAKSTELEEFVTVMEAEEGEVCESCDCNPCECASEKLTEDEEGEVCESCDCNPCECASEKLTEDDDNDDDDDKDSDDDKSDDDDDKDSDDDSDDDGDDDGDDDDDDDDSDDDGDDTPEGGDDVPAEDAAEGDDAPAPEDTPAEDTTVEVEDAPEAPEDGSEEEEEDNDEDKMVDDADAAAEEEKEEGEEDLEKKSDVDNAVEADVATVLDDEEEEGDAPEGDDAPIDDLADELENDGAPVAAAVADAVGDVADAVQDEMGDDAPAADDALASDDDVPPTDGAADDMPAVGAEVVVNDEMTDSGLAGAEGAQTQTQEIAGNDNMDAAAGDTEGPAEQDNNVVDDGHAGAGEGQTQAETIPGAANAMAVAPTGEEAEITIPDNIETAAVAQQDDTSSEEIGDGVADEVGDLPTEDDAPVDDVPPVDADDAPAEEAPEGDAPAEEVVVDGEEESTTDDESTVDDEVDQDVDPMGDDNYEEDEEEDKANEALNTFLASKGLDAEEIATISSYIGEGSLAAKLHNGSPQLMAKVMPFVREITSIIEESGAKRVSTNTITRDSFVATVNEAFNGTTNKMADRIIAAYDNFEVAKPSRLYDMAMHESVAGDITGKQVLEMTHSAVEKLAFYNATDKFNAVLEAMQTVINTEKKNPDLNEALDVHVKVAMKGSEKHGVITSINSAEKTYTVLWDGGETGDYGQDQLEELEADIADNDNDNVEAAEAANKKAEEEAAIGQSNATNEGFENNRAAVNDTFNPEGLKGKLMDYILGHLWRGAATDKQAADLEAELGDIMMDLKTLEVDTEGDAMEALAHMLTTTPADLAPLLSKVIQANAKLVDDRLSEKKTEVVTESDDSDESEEDDIQVWTKAKVKIDFGPFKEDENVEIDASQFVSAGDQDAIKLKEPKDEIKTIPKKYLEVQEGGEGTTTEISDKLENALKNLEDAETLLKSEDKINKQEISDAVGKVKAFKDALKSGE